MRKMIVAAVLGGLLVAMTPSPAAAAHKPRVGCIDRHYEISGRVKPRTCTLVLKHQCGGNCAADQYFVGDCNWKRWTHRRAKGRCTHRGNMGFHERVGISLHRVRHHRFNRATIDGRRHKIWYWMKPLPFK